MAIKNPLKEIAKIREQMQDELKKLKPLEELKDQVQEAVAKSSKNDIKELLEGADQALKLCNSFTLLPKFLQAYLVINTALWLFLASLIFGIGTE